MSGAFGAVPSAELSRLIGAHPLAWIVAHAAPGLATPMPMLVECDAEGKPVTLLGHLPRAHPLVPALTADPAASFLFQGPHGYITPGWMSDKDWAPTWNFAVIAVEADVMFDASITDEALSRLVAHMEPQEGGWTTDALGARYATLRDRVIGFRAMIRAVRPRFKLGQDERPAVREQIIDGLGNDPLA